MTDEGAGASAPELGRRVSLRTPLAATVLVLAFHALWIGAYLAAGHEARDFIKIGTHFEGLSNKSSVIKIDPTYVPPRNRDAP